MDRHDLDELGIPFCDVALSGLTVSPGRLEQPFDSSLASFDATVYQSRVTIAASLVEGGTYAILDDSANPIADADATATGFQIDLASDMETVQVRVVSSNERRRSIYNLNLAVEGPSAPVLPPSDP